MRRIADFVAVLVSTVGLMLTGAGCNKEAPPAGPGKPNPDPPPAAANKLSAPVWTKKVFDKQGYEVELPGQPTVISYVGNTESIGCHIVSFTDSDLELHTFVLPLPAEKFRSLDHFNDTYAPILTAKDARGFKDSGSMKVDVNGKKGIQITFKRQSAANAGSPDLIYYRMFLVDKIYVVAALGNNLPQAQAVIDRFFQSLKIDGKQPEFPPDDGKPIPLAFQKYTATIEGYQIDMPGKVQVQTTKGAKIGGFERTAAVQIYGTDLEFGVNAIRQVKRDKTDEVYLAGAKLNAPTLFPGGKLTMEKKVVVDGQECLELNITTDKGKALCRVVRSPRHDYGFEIFVQGSKLDDYQGDIERFFKSFKFAAKDK